MSRIAQLTNERLNESRERGAVMALVAIAIVLIMVSGAMAVDLSALERQGQTLQNTADAAALAGVATWADSGSQTDAIAEVQNLIAQNGVEIGSEVSLQVTFPSADEITVDLVDNEPEIFLAGFIGMGDALGRNASAALELCNDGCERTIQIPPPVGGINAKGSGDGYQPIPVGDRLYSVNHHEYTMAETYLYHPEPNCLIGLGHAAIFFSLRPDMSGPCDGSSAQIDVEPCVCGGKVVWPPIAATNLDGVSSLEIRVLDPDGNILLPTNGGWIDLTTGTFDLSEITDVYTHLTIEVQVEVIDVVDPWADGVPPAIQVGITEQGPQLIE